MKLSASQEELIRKLVQKAKRGRKVFKIEVNGRTLTSLVKMGLVKSTGKHVLLTLEGERLFNKERKALFLTRKQIHTLHIIICTELERNAQAEKKYWDEHDVCNIKDILRRMEQSPTINSSLLDSMDSAFYGEYEERGVENEKR